MAASSSYILFVPATSDQPWRIAKSCRGKVEINQVPAGADTDTANDCQVIAAALTERGYSGGGIVLALPSSWCLCASIDIAELPRASRQQAMLYKLEEKLPLPAEQLVADFVPIDTKTAMGVCVELTRLENLVGSLEQRGIEVRSICPAALLALSQVLKLNPQASSVAIGCNGHIDLLTARGGKPDSWQLVGHKPQELLLKLGLSAAEGRVGEGLIAVDVDEATTEAAQQLSQVEKLDGSLFELAALAAEGIPHGHSQPWIDLRRGALAASDPHRFYRKPMTYAVALVVLFLVLLNFSLLWHAGKYNGVVQEQQAQAQTLFSSTLPNQKTPSTLAAIRTRLESESRKLHALAGASADTPIVRSALATLHEVLSGLPKDLRYRILRLDIESNRIYIDGQARSHGEADAVAASLRKQPKFTVEPPRTELLAGGQGVTFSLSATRQEGGQP